jgi:hypothetical protein
VAERFKRFLVPMYATVRLMRYARGPCDTLSTHWYRGTSSMNSPFPRYLYSKKKKVSKFRETLYRILNYLIFIDFRIKSIILNYLVLSNCLEQQDLLAPEGRGWLDS